MEDLCLNTLHERFLDKRTGVQNFNPNQFAALIQFRRNVGTQLNAARFVLFVMLGLRNNKMQDIFLLEVRQLWYRYTAMSTSRTSVLGMS